MTRMDNRGLSSVYVLISFIVVITYFSVISSSANTLLGLKKSSHEVDEVSYVSYAVKRAVALSLDNVDVNAFSELCSSVGGSAVKSFTYTISGVRAGDMLQIPIVVTYDAGVSLEESRIYIDYTYKGNSYQIICGWKDIYG